VKEPGYAVQAPRAAAGCEATSRRILTQLLTHCVFILPDKKVLNETGDQGLGSEFFRFFGGRTGCIRVPLGFTGLRWRLAGVIGVIVSR